MSAQSCGTCKWLDTGTKPPKPRSAYPCKAPIPSSLSGPDWEIENMLPRDGSDCPCYAPRVTPPASEPDHG